MEHLTRAVHIPIADPDIQAYLQRYPFTSGPDQAMNLKARKAVVDCIALRPPAEPYEPMLLLDEQTRLPATELARAKTIFAAMNMPPDMQEVHLNDFAWEANLLPRSLKNVLVIGCGDGVELVFLRAILPHARLTAIDYHNSLLPGLKDAVGLEFLQGDMGLHLKSLTRGYDLVFSNHTMEHLYTPDETISTLVGLMEHGGYLASVLPMVGMQGSPFLEKVHSLAASKIVHPLDMIYLDAGHPWKTNPADLKQTMERAGLGDVRLFQRANHLSRPIAASPARFQFKKGLLLFLNKCSFGVLRRLTKMLFRARVPRKLPKLFFALERRLSFGTNRLMNSHSQEAFVIGRLDS